VPCGAAERNYSAMLKIKKLIGNEKNLEHLKAAHKAGRLSHAYIISGEKGSGKKTFAAYVAKTLLCMGDEETDKPCGSCPSCIKVDTGNHPDLIWVEHAKPTVLTVDEVRGQIISNIDIAPFYGPYKIYIIKDAELMNVHGQNALLKTLEEPPKYAVIFILTDNAEGLLDTIKSRSICLDMEKLPRSIIVDQLIEKNVPDTRASELAALSRGNLGAAMALASDEKLEAGRTELIKMLKRLGNTDALEIYEWASDMTRSHIESCLGFMRLWYRDILIMKTGATDMDIYFEKEKQTLKKHAAAMSFEGLNRILGKIDEAEQRIDASVKIEAVLETLLMTIREEMKKL